MLVSLVCVLLLMMAYTQLFSDVGSKVGESRSMIELTSRMRSAARAAERRFGSPHLRYETLAAPEAGAGYFEYIEGPLSDKNNGLNSTTYTGNFDSVTNPPSGSPIHSIDYFPLGDSDDVLMFTARSKDGPFTGRYNGTTVQSEVAEVVWFLRPTMMASGTAQVDPPTFTLYRRAFLVMPTYNGNPVTVNEATYSANPQNYDVSMHSDGNGNYIGNTLGDLTKRNAGPHIFMTHQSRPMDFRIRSTQRFWFRLAE